MSLVDIQQDICLSTSVHGNGIVQRIDIHDSKHSGASTTCEVSLIE